MGGDLHSAADTSAVCRGDHEHRFFVAFAVYLQRDLMEFTFYQSQYQRNVIFGYALESFHFAVAHQYVDVHSRAGAVYCAPVTQIQIIGINYVVVQYKIYGFDGVGRNACRADKIVSGSAGYNADIDFFKVGYAVQDFVQGAVAAHNYQIGVVALVQFGGDFLCVQGVIGFVYGIFYAAFIQYGFDFFKGKSAAAFCRRGVQNYIEHISISLWYAMIINYILSKINIK